MKNVDVLLQETTQSYLDTRPESTLKNAIAYALGGTGKKLRPKLMLSIIQSRGEDMKPYLNAALALELVHTYSLVHDDLPAMDDDDLRRGQATTHIKFDEATAILVGDALLSDAFHLITGAEEIDTEIRLTMVDILSKKIGSSGMVYGQALDIESEGKTLESDDLMAINLHKTSNLLEAAIMMGAVAAQEKSLPAYESLARDLGLLYQIQDDVLEAESDEVTLGKSFSDDRRQKPTFVTLLGKNGAEALRASYAKRLHEKIAGLQLAGTEFERLIEQILKRTY